MRSGVTTLVVVNLLLLTSLEGRAASSGQLDPAFGRAGKVVTAFAHGDSRAFAVKAQPNGKLVAVGESDGGSLSSFALARYQTDGALDRRFGLHGEIRTGFRAKDATATAVAIQRNGRIIVAGPTGSSTSAQRRIALARYLPDGKLDPNFGSGGGKVMTPIHAPTAGVFLGAGLVLERNGKIVVAGTADPGSGVSRFAIARYNADGSLDSSFGDQGEVTTGFGSNAAVATALALEPGGGFVVAGYTFEGKTFTLQGFAVARYNKNGSPDSTFGSDGEVTTVVGAASAAAAVAVQSDGKILVGGSTFVDKNLQVRHFALVRYGQAGGLDRSFGQGGMVTTTFTKDDAIQGIAVSTGDEILATGSTVTQRGARYRFALARYRSDGSLDPHFGSGGKVTTGFGEGDDQSHAVTTEPDGKFVVAGEASDPVTNRVKFALGRYFDRTICRVPSVKGLPIARAKRAIVRASCSVGRIRAEFSPTVRRGHVISQRPSVGAERHQRAKVMLVVSRGTRPGH